MPSFITEELLEAMTSAILSVSASSSSLEDSTRDTRPPVSAADAVIGSPEELDVVIGSP